MPCYAFQGNKSYPNQRQSASVSFQLATMGIHAVNVSAIAPRPYPVPSWAITLDSSAGLTHISAMSQRSVRFILLQNGKL